MKLSAPKKTTWWTSLILAAAGVFFNFVYIPFLSLLSFWMILASAVILIIAVRVKNI